MTPEQRAAIVAGGRAAAKELPRPTDEQCEAVARILAGPPTAIRITAKSKTRRDAWAA